MTDNVNLDLKISKLEKEWGLRMRYENYLTWADDGEGGDNTRNGEPLLTFEEWLER